MVKNAQNSPKSSKNAVFRLFVIEQPIEMICITRNQKFKIRKIEKKRDDRNKL